MSDCKNSLILSNKNFCHCLIVAEFLQYLDKSWDPYCLIFFSPEISSENFIFQSGGGKRRKCFDQKLRLHTWKKIRKQHFNLFSQKLKNKYDENG